MKIQRKKLSRGGLKASEKQKQGAPAVGSGIGQGENGIGVSETGTIAYSESHGLFGLLGHRVYVGEIKGKIPHVDFGITFKNTGVIIHLYAKRHRQPIDWVLDKKCVGILVETLLKYQR